MWKRVEIKVCKRGNTGRSPQTGGRWKKNERCFKPLQCAMTMHRLCHPETFRGALLVHLLEEPEILAGQVIKRC